MKEMPLTIAEAALGEMEEDGEDEGFEVYGDEDSVSVFGVCWHCSREGRREVPGRVGVVVITLASHARGREFNPRIR